MAIDDSSQVSSSKYQDKLKETKSEEDEETEKKQHLLNFHLISSIIIRRVGDRNVMTKAYSHWFSPTGSSLSLYQLRDDTMMINNLVVGSKPSQLGYVMSS